MERHTLDVRDLLGLPYQRGAIDCLWSARAALQRAFPDFAPEELPLDEDACLALARDPGARWSRVRFPNLLGDLLFGEKPEPWVAVLVDVEGSIAFTALPERGTCLVPIRRLQISSVFRRST